MAILGFFLFAECKFKFKASEFPSFKNNLHENTVGFFLVGRVFIIGRPIDRGMFVERFYRHLFRYCAKFSRDFDVQEI